MTFPEMNVGQKRVPKGTLFFCDQVHNFPWSQIYDQLFVTTQ